MPETLGDGTTTLHKLTWHVAKVTGGSHLISLGLARDSPLRVLEASSPPGPINLAEQAGWGKPHCTKAEMFLQGKKKKSQVLIKNKNWRYLNFEKVICQCSGCKYFQSTTSTVQSTRVCPFVLGWHYESQECSLARTIVLNPLSVTGSLAISVSTYNKVSMALLGTYKVYYPKKMKSKV